MAKYKEKWPNPLVQQVIGYLDTETGAHIPNAVGNKDYQDVQEWLSAGGVPDPAYTQEEIDAYMAEQEKDGDLDAARDTYAIPGMSLSEREALIEDLLDPAVNVAQLKDAVNDILKQMIVYL